MKIVPVFRQVVSAIGLTSILCFAHAANDVDLLLSSTKPTEKLTFNQRPDVQVFIKKMSEQYAIEESVLNSLFSRVELKPSIINIFDRPPTSRPWYQYKPSFINATRIKNGVAFWKKYPDLLAQAHRKYGVPEEIIVAILGAETNYGQNMGTFRTIDVLSTVAFDYPRRAEYFKGELEQFILLAQEEGRNPLTLKSSFAGAMGWPQFMPSSFRKYGIDFDADGKRDVWTDPADVIGSVAYYFNQFGWQDGQATALRATVTGDKYQALLADKFNLKYTIAELREMGVVSATYVPDDTKALLFPLETEAGIEYWLGLQNFYAITRYNKSTLYAMSIHLLAQDIRKAYEAQPTGNNNNLGTRLPRKSAP